VATRLRSPGDFAAISSSDLGLLVLRHRPPQTLNEPLSSRPCGADATPDEDAPQRRTNAGDHLGSACAVPRLCAPWLHATPSSHPAMTGLHEGHTARLATAPPATARTQQASTAASLICVGSTCGLKTTLSSTSRPASARPPGPPVCAPTPNVGSCHPARPGATASERSLGCSQFANRTLPDGPKRGGEPPRELRRLLTLGGWSHEQATAAGDVPG
jgi:hypothetical protein